MGFDSDHLRLDAAAELLVDIFKVGRFPSPARAIVNDLRLNLFLFQIDDGHGTQPHLRSIGLKRFWEP
jgi:hypothetical protein